LAGEDGFIDEACWDEDAGRSSFSSADSDRWHGEEVTSVRGGLVEGEHTLDKLALLDKTSPPRYFSQEKHLSTPSLLLKSSHGEDDDNDRRRKVSLDQAFSGSAHNKGGLAKSTAEDLSTPLLASSSACHMTRWVRAYG